MPAFEFDTIRTTKPLWKPAYKWRFEGRRSDQTSLDGQSDLSLVYIHALLTLESSDNNNDDRYDQPYRQNQYASSPLRIQIVRCRPAGETGTCRIPSRTGPRPQLVRP
jgi:hypothetical protein